jgi:hypothetical protein
MRQTRVTRAHDTILASKSGHLRVFPSVDEHHGAARHLQHLLKRVLHTAKPPAQVPPFVYPPPRLQRTVADWKQWCQALMIGTGWHT